MLSNIFNMENDFWTFANKVADMVILEIIWLVCCLPIITAGASCTAFWHVFVRLARDEESHVAAGFFRAFKKRFVTGTRLWLIQAAVGIFFLVDFYVCLNMETDKSMFLAGCLGVLFFIWLLVSLWFYPLAGTYEFTWRKVMGNSLYLTLRHMPYALTCLALLAASVAASIYVPYGFILLPVLACYVNAKVYAWIFEQYDSVCEDQ